MLVEKHPSTTIHPKARNLTVLSMEIMRPWGILDELREIALPADWTKQIISPCPHSTRVKTHAFLRGMKFAPRAA